MIVRRRKFALRTDVSIHALDFAVQMRCARSVFTSPIAVAHQDTQEIHSPVVESPILVCKLA